MDALGEFREALAARLASARNVEGIPEHTVDTLTKLLREDGAPGTSSPNSNPLGPVFDEALRTAMNTAKSEIDLQLLNCLSDVAGRLEWFRRPSGTGSTFHADHVDAEIIGRKGFRHTDGLTIGLTIMQPDTAYPDHHHPPEEIYLVLSQGDWRQKDGPWHEPGYGGYVYNPPDIVHAMRANDQPLLTIWCLNHSNA